MSGEKPKIINGTSDEFNRIFPVRTPQEWGSNLCKCTEENPLRIMLYGNGLSSRYWNAFKNPQIVQMALEFLDNYISQQKIDNLIMIEALKATRNIILGFSKFSFEDCFLSLNSFEKIGKITSEIILEENAKVQFNHINNVHTIVMRSFLILFFQISILFCSFKSSIDTKRNIRKFMCVFDRIFTLSYDPLVYWSLLKDTSSDGQICDLFYYGLFSPNTYTKTLSTISKSIIYNLHGSVWHHTNEKNQYCKRSGSPTKDMINSIGYKMFNSTLLTLAKDLKENNLRGKRSVVKHINCVMEGDSTSKIEQINSNQYMKYCFKTYNSLLQNEEIPKRVLVCGVGLSDKDNHISEAIKNARNADIYITTTEERICDQYDKILRYINENNPTTNLEFIKIGYDHGLPCDEIL